MGWSKDFESSVGTIRAGANKHPRYNLFPVLRLSVEKGDPGPGPAFPSRMVMSWTPGKNPVMSLSEPDLTDDDGAWLQVQMTQANQGELLKGLAKWRVMAIVVDDGVGDVVSTHWWHSPSNSIYKAPLLEGYFQDAFAIIAGGVHAATAPQLYPRLKLLIVPTAPDQPTPEFIANDLIKEMVKVHPLPWPEDPNAFHEACVASYQETLAYFYGLATDPKNVVSNDHLTREQARYLGRWYWSQLRNARIFEIRPEAYSRLEHEVTQWVKRHVYDRLVEQDSKHPLGDYEADKYFTDAAAQVPHPTNLPFEHCWLSFGNGVALKPLQITERNLDKLAGVNRLGEAFLIGMLITRRGEVHEVIRLRKATVPMMDIALRAIDGKQFLQWTLWPWLVQLLINGLNDHRVIRTQNATTLSQKMSFKKLGKLFELKQPMLPPPFYTVIMKDDVINDSASTLTRIRKEVAWSHRWDVRGHELVKLHRGKLPLDPKLEEKLKRYKYKIFTVDNPDADTYRILMSRNKPPKAPDEWLAIKVTWRDSFVKGPEDKPYVPSTHVPTKGLIAIK